MKKQETTSVSTLTAGNLRKQLEFTPDNAIVVFVTGDIATRAVEADVRIEGTTLKGGDTIEGNTLFITDRPIADIPELAIESLPEVKAEEEAQPE